MQKAPCKQRHDRDVEAAVREVGAPVFQKLYNVCRRQYVKFCNHTGAGGCGLREAPGAATTVGQVGSFSVRAV